jgi:5'(3')-deoxyribonucleotidase
MTQKPANKPTIAIVIDDVLADVRKYINRAYNLKRTPAHYDIEAPYGKYFERVWGG